MPYAFINKFINEFIIVLYIDDLNIIGISNELP